MKTWKLYLIYIIMTVVLIWLIPYFMPYGQSEKTAYGFGVSLALLFSIVAPRNSNKRRRG